MLDIFFCEMYEWNAWLNEFCKFSLLDVIAVVVSGFALLFAILIPVRIAKRQDKIALFEKRFAAYSDFLKIKTFASILSKENFCFARESVAKSVTLSEIETRSKRALVLWHFNTIIGKNPNDDGEDSLQKTMAILSEKEMSLHALQFLYSKKIKKITTPEALNKEIEKMFVSLAAFMCDVSLNKSVNDQDRIDFVECANNLYDKYADFFEKHLNV